jgi:hypothetical protein
MRSGTRDLSARPPLSAAAGAKSREQPGQERRSAAWKSGHVRNEPSGELDDEATAGAQRAGVLSRSLLGFGLIMAPSIATGSCASTRLNRADRADRSRGVRIWLRPRWRSEAQAACGRARAGNAGLGVPQIMSPVRRSGRQRIVLERKGRPLKSRCER